MTEMMMMTLRNLVLTWRRIQFGEWPTILSTAHFKACWLFLSLSMAIAVIALLSVPCILLAAILVFRLNLFLKKIYKDVFSEELRRPNDEEIKKRRAEEMKHIWTVFFLLSKLKLISCNGVCTLLNLEFFQPLNGLKRTEKQRRNTKRRVFNFSWLLITIYFWKIPSHIL